MEGLSFLESEVKMPLMNLPVRSVLVTCKSGKVLISPCSSLAQHDYRSEKGITDIVGPSVFHGAGVNRASEVFPDARLWYAPKLNKAKPYIRWTHELNQEAWPYQDELPMVLIRGMPKVNEVVFYHRASRSLIVADLFFNLTGKQGLGAWLILKMFGTYNKFGVSRFFSKFILDKSAFSKSMEEILSFDIDNIIVSHGSILNGEGKSRAMDALRARGLVSPL